MAILTAVFALGKSFSVGPPPLEGGGGGEGGGVWQKQQFSDKLKDLIMKHPREKHTYLKQHENDLLKK